MRQERSNGASRAVVQVCLLFRPRPVASARWAARRSCGVEARTPRAGRHPAVTSRANALEIEHDRPRWSTNAVPARMIPRAGFVNPKNVLKDSGPVQPQGSLDVRGAEAEESNMASRLVTGGVLGAAAGAALTVAVSFGPSAAFTLSSPSLDQPVVTANIQHVWWDRWGRWHPNYWRWGWRHPYWHPYWRPWRHCWWTWHGRVCRWY